MNENSIIKLCKLKKVYNHGNENQFCALSDISMEIQTSEMVAIVGKSGAGKSTLLHVIACIESYEDGEYFLDGELIKNVRDSSLALVRNRKIGIVMQDFALIDDFTCLENVMLPLDISKVKNRKEKAKEALEEVGLYELASKQVMCLSGGQKQRVAIARAIVNSPKLILADEPTGALDSANSHSIMNMFHQLHEKGNTILIVTHDTMIANQCDRIITLSDGRIV